MKVFLTAISDVGCERDNNEDNYCVCPDLSKGDWQNSGDFADLGEGGAISIVADGMGGPQAGEVASGIAIDTFKKRFAYDELKSLLAEPDKIEGWLKDSISEANDAIIHRAETDPATIGMGTTVLIVWLLSNKAYIAWCGDCRCYLFRNGSMKRVSKDHSYVQELVDKGEITQEEAFNHPDGNLITRGLGDIGASAEAETAIIPIKEGDILMSCSDGLCSMCRDNQIEQIVTEYSQLPPLCRDALIKAALQAGGYDNITVSVLATASSSVDEPKSFWERIKRLFNR